ncbi:FecR family protein [Sideroxydans lithotrophicus]|uniref:FecR protein domain-containing protein n=1 Tax=Sideroxydans lithotrophicus (strain ES-1) TaxID=580332 RepID=D5CUQ2_SIDLE|nr:FecR family protein [Sideroxydans lithotrophicus]ADE12439.1 conserved hypothetical protein [Sideroxydans lithotrophicus ES-1]
MTPQERFKLTRQAMLLATISAAFPVTAYCAAGRVDFTIGNVEAIAANGSRHPVYKGTEINSGETINTAAGARAQVRFADGGFVSLQPGTVFRVDEFNYKGKADGEEKGFFSLLKGGFRAITGVIGHLNKDTYRVKTPAATLGIRGTGYNMALRDDGLFVNVGEGAISLNNNGGLLVVTAGNAAYVANFNTAPVPTTEQPLTPPNGLQEPTFTVADQRDNSGSLALISLPSGPGYAMADAYTTTAAAFGTNLLTGVTALFSGASQLTQYNWIDVNGAPQTGSLGGAAVSFSATDGIIGWGRWVGTTAGTAAPNPLTGVFDYVIGIPTAAMPTTGTATYSLMGYTSPTATDGSTGYSVNGTLAVNFAATSGQVGVNMTVANSSTNTYGINGALTITPGTATFAGVTNYTNLTNCTAGCSTSVNGFFAGASASRAGLSYSITNNLTANHIQGVAAFAKN